MTPEQFDIYLAEKEAKQARERWALYPELRYEILRMQYEYGEISKEVYERVLENLTKDIEIIL
jgi:hypothetical protein